MVGVLLIATAFILLFSLVLGALGIYVTLLIIQSFEKDMDNIIRGK